MARVNCTDTFKAWTAGKTCRKARSVWTDGKTIFSYATPIVQLTAPHAVTFNAERYSVTTTVHQNALRHMLESNGYNITLKP